MLDFSGQSAGLWALIALFFVLPIAAGLLKRWLFPKARALGRKQGVALDEKVANSKWANAPLDKIATALYVPDSGFEVVQRTLATAKGVIQIAPTQWNLAFAKPDEISFAWADAPEPGGQLQVIRTVEMLDGPVGDRQWLKVLTRVEKALGEAGITTERRQLERLARTEGNPPSWVRPESLV